MSLQADISRAEETSLTNEDISHFLKNDVHVVLYTQLINLSDIRTLFIETSNVVLLYPVESRTNGHYVALWYDWDTNTLNHWDSYGMTINEDIKHSKQLMHSETRNTRLALPHLLDKFKKDGGTLIVNQIRMQVLNNQISTCGRWSIVRLLMKHLDNKQFRSYMKLKDLTPDEIISLMTFAYLRK